MINTGIHTLQQLNNRSSLKGPFGQDKRISITLYDQILQHPLADELIERTLLLFTDERGAYKRTYANRFEDFDLIVLEKMQKLLDINNEIVVQDLGISDGRTAVDFFHKITHAYQNVNYYASDYNPKIYVIEKGATKVTLSHNLNVIEIVWPPFVFNVARPDRYWRAPLNRIIQFFVEETVVAQMLTDFKAKLIKPREIFLFGKAALSLSGDDNRFTLLAQSILEPFTRQSHVIRTMNILNPTYFTQKEFAKIVSNIFDGLYDNGLLILGSNQNPGSIVHGGIYQKIGNKYKKIWQSGNGSCIDELLLTYQN